MRIEERKNQASEKRIKQKAEEIAKYLGLGDEKNEHDGIERHYTYQSGVFFIESYFTYSRNSDGETAGSSTQVVHRGNIVFEERGGEVHSYVPGRWERAFDAIYSSAITISKDSTVMEGKKTEALKKKMEREIARKWGL